MNLILSQKSTHQTIISSQDIATIERATMKPHCLFLEVRGKTYWLSLTSDEELYGWLDDLIHHCHRNSITAPENFVHHVHVSYDYIAERFQVCQVFSLHWILYSRRRGQGLPIQWQKILDVSGCSFEEDDEIEACSAVALRNPHIVGPKFILRRPPSLYPDPRLDRLCDVYYMWPWLDWNGHVWNESTNLFVRDHHYRQLPSRFYSKLVFASRQPWHIRFSCADNAYTRRSIYFSSLRYVALPTRDHVVRKTHFATIRFSLSPHFLVFHPHNAPKSGFWRKG